MMIEEPQNATLEIIKENYYFQANFTTNQVRFLLISIHQENCQRFQTLMQLPFNHQLLSQFEVPSELYKFMIKQTNFKIDTTNGILLLLWSIIGQQYSKKIQYQIQLQSKQLNNQQRLKCQLIILKKRLFKLQQQKRHKSSRSQSIDDSPKPIKRVIEKLKKRGRPFQRANQILERVQKRKDQETQFNKGQNIQEKNKNEHLNKHKKKRGRRKFSLRRVKRGQKRKSQKITTNKEEKELNEIFQEVQQSHKDEHNLRKKQNKLQDQISSRKSKVQIIDEDEDNISFEQCSTYVKRKIGKNRVRIDFKNGDYYEGGIKNRVFNGIGKYNSKITGTYEGEWKNGQSNGRGVLIDIDGNKHQGMYKDDVRHGKGIDWYANGDRYEGDFVNGNKEGYGTYYYNNGVYYQGQWKNDLSEGHGREYYTDGTFFQGNWIADQKHGTGIFHGKTNKIKQVWKKGKKISEQLIKRIK